MLILAEKILMHPGRRFLEKGAVLIDNGRISAAGPAETMLKRHRRRKVIDCSGSVLLPGLVNVHTHLELPSMSGKIQASSYSRWVMNLIRQKAGLTPRDYRTAVRQNIAALLRTGSTTVGDICTHEISPAIIARSGLRAVIFHEMISIRPSDRIQTLLHKHHRRTRLVHHGLSPHSPHTVSEELIRQVASLARRKEIPLCMHVAESSEEVRLLQGKPGGLDDLYQAAGWKKEWAPRGRSSFEYLVRTGILEIPFLAVHALHVDSRDLEIIRKSGTTIAHCPRSNHAMRTGTMPLRRMLDLGIPVGLGTDSLASVPTLSLWDEMRFALRTHRKSGVTASDILRLATLGGAQALGMSASIGSIEPGKLGDLIAVPLPRRSTGDLASDLLRETKSCTMTMVNGTVLHRENASALT